jgi:hypothetical protein
MHHRAVDSEQSTTGLRPARLSPTRLLVGRATVYTVSAQGISRGSKPVRSWRRSAPPSIGWPLAATYGSMLLPASLGAIWTWPALITTALLAPGYILYLVLSNRAAKERGVYRLPTDERFITAGCSSVLCVLAASIPPRHLAPLTFVLVFIMVVDPVWRAVWRHRPREEWNAGAI